MKGFRRCWRALKTNNNQYLIQSILSRQYHDTKHIIGADKDESWHQSEGGFLKPIIFGGLDGILTSFAIVAGAAGGGLSPEVVMVLGFSNIFADALRYAARTSTLHLASTEF